MGMSSRRPPGLPGYGSCKVKGWVQVAGTWQLSTLVVCEPDK